MVAGIGIVERRTRLDWRAQRDRVPEANFTDRRQQLGGRDVVQAASAVRRPPARRAFELVVESVEFVGSQPSWLSHVRVQSLLAITQLWIAAVLPSSAGFFALRHERSVLCVAPPKARPLPGLARLRAERWRPVEPVTV